MSFFLSFSCGSSLSFFFSSKKHTEKQRVLQLAKLTGWFWGLKVLNFVGNCSGFMFHFWISVCFFSMGFTGWEYLFAKFDLKLKEGG